LPKLDESVPLEVLDTVVEKAEEGSHLVPSRDDLVADQAHSDPYQLVQNLGKQLNFVFIELVDLRDLKFGEQHFDNSAEDRFMDLAGILLPVENQLLKERVVTNITLYFLLK
jgi:hypothetical protein